MKLQLNQYKSLIELSRSDSLITGSFELFINKAVVALSNELKVSRASFWTYNKEKEWIHNELLLDNNSKKFSSGDVLYRRDFPKYFDAFQNELWILADDALTDPRTKEFKDNYLNVHNIKSMLDVQVSVEGKLFGIICLEQTGEIRQWKKNEELFASSVASYVAQSYITKLKKEEEAKRRQSETNYQKLFNDSPIPMWVYDEESFDFLAVNNAAIRNYGYSKNEFLSMNVFDLNSKPVSEKLRNHFNTDKDNSYEKKHVLKNGKEISIELSSDVTTYRGKSARIVTALDITKEKKLIDEKEDRLKKFKDFTFYAAHDIREPVVRLIGLNKVLEIERKKKESSEKTLNYIHDSVVEIDKTLFKLNTMLEHMMREDVDKLSN